eukprot:5359653-Prymnesium_polylepis.1
MPGIVILWEQRCLLQKRLQEAATAYPLARNWSDASGTVIMEDALRVALPAMRPRTYAPLRTDKRRPHDAVLRVWHAATQASATHA